MRLFGRLQSAAIAGLAVIGVASAVLIPVAPRIGFSGQAKTCEAFGSCRTAEVMTRACTVDTTSTVRGQAATPVYYEQAGGMGLRFFADGTAGVVGDGGDGMRSHRFSSGQRALRWMVGRNQTESRAADRVWGPGVTGPTQAVLGSLDKVGLGSRTEAGDTSDVARTEDGSTVAAGKPGGGYSVAQAVELPAPVGGRLTGLVQWLGIDHHVIVATEYSADGKPLSLTLLGPARKGWDLRVLTGTQPSVKFAKKSQTDSQLFTLRSYTLDLTEEKNAQVFDAAFPNEQSAVGYIFRSLPLRPYAESSAPGDDRRYPTDDLARRLQSDAVLVETSYKNPTGGPLSAQATLALAAGAPMAAGSSGTAGAADAFEPRLISGEAIDLQRPQDRLEPFVNCDADSTPEGQG